MQNPSTSTAVDSRIEYLTPSSEVSMADSWYDIAGIDHFWIKGRFRAMKKLVPRELWAGAKIAEIGCGNGCVQRQIEDQYDIAVDGFDLNVWALTKSVAQKSRLFCYDVFSRKPELNSYYDMIILFDVIEHITDEKGFLDAVLYHLKPGGRMLINTPADMRIYSEYDKAAGHVRRYNRSGFETIAKNHHLNLEVWSYWGLPLYPLLMVRKRILRPGASEKETIEKGFRPPNLLMGSILGGLLSAEPLPNHFLGTSIMGLYQKTSA